MAIYAEAAVAVQHLKVLVIFPLFTTFATFVLILYSGAVFGYLYTAGRLEFKNLTFSSISERDLLSTGDVGVFALEVDTTSAGFLLYHILGHFWSQQVIHAISITTIAGSVSQWYWTRDKQAVRPSAILRALKRSLVDFFGSLVFGALFIAVVQIIRTLFYYLEKRTKRLQDYNMVVKVIFRIIDCCLRCFEKMLKFITRQAFVMIAIQGLPFCSSAKEAVSYMAKNIGRIAVVNFIGTFVILLFKVAIVAAAVGIEWAWLNTDQQFQAGGERALYSQVLSLLLTALLSYWIATAFTHVYSITVDTIVLCFCMDVDKNRETKKYFMGKGLKRFFAAQKRKKKRMASEPKASDQTNKQGGKEQPQSPMKPNQASKTSSTVVPS